MASSLPRSPGPSAHGDRSLSQPSAPPPTSALGGGPGPSLRTKLLGLLLAFGVLPLAAASIVGYTVSRATILEQSRDALEGVTAAWAIHFASELDREHLVLRTIAGQLPDPTAMSRMSSPRIAALLVNSLPTNGVFDGLRITTDDGRILASVALQETAPHWPPLSPAGAWDSVSVVVHRDGDQVLAYLVGARLSAVPGLWIEGHVPAADFGRVFSVPEHLLDGVEAVVFQEDGQPVFGTHRHAVEELSPLVRRLGLDSSATHRLDDDPRALTRVVPLVGAPWTLVAILPIDFALAPITRLRNGAILGGIVLGLTILATGAMASRTITTPLRSLAEAARLLEREEHSTPLRVGSQDEIGTLVSAFNAMTAHLAQSRDEVAQLHSRELERAQQLATVGELASGIAHEIRNPLTGVRGAIELAMRKIPSEDASRGLLDEAQQQLTRIERTTTQLLRYARPPELREVTVDANLLVARAATIAAPRATEADASLHVVESSHPLLVKVDPELIVQVLVNLLLNGIEAMSSGGTIEIWAAAHAPDAWIGVHDTGPGIPPEHQQEVFRPFFSTKHTGTGLGLPISRDIVTRHGGTLRLEASPTGGTTFVVALPLSESTEEPQ